MKNVLVLCTGNSCRSIMGEALINHMGAGHFQAVSAGSSPAGYIHPGSIDTLARQGIDCLNPQSKSWDEFADREFDVVITVCDEAAKEQCPAFPGDYQRLHWSIPDPANEKGSQQDIENAFEAAFQLLKKRIESELF